MKSPEQTQSAVRPVFCALLLLLLLPGAVRSSTPLHLGRTSLPSSQMQALPAAGCWRNADLSLLRPSPAPGLGDRQDARAVAVIPAVSDPLPGLRPQSDSEIPLSGAASLPAPAVLKSDGPDPVESFLNPASPEPAEDPDATFQSIILEASARHDVHPALIKAIIMAESGFNARAVSTKGAKGLMQLMPRTASALGVNDLFDPKENIEGGVSYFKKLLTMFNRDVKLALAAYNAGHYHVLKYKGIPPFRATRHYIRKVVEYFEHYSGARWSSLLKAGYLVDGMPDGGKSGHQS